MCGIAGIINFNGESASAELLSSMSRAMKHRGPDDDGICVKENVGLAHRRLSIIDLAAGAQPMSNEDGSVWVIFNGEIYNHAELRPALEKKDHVFKTRCDTEVLVHLYEEYGNGCVKYLNGMFAFALYDSRRKLVLLVRDRLGQKPLVYFNLKNKFVFASELQALAKHPDMPADYNLQAVHDYLSLQYIPSPHTVYSGVRKLPPGHLMEISTAKKAVRLQRYWTPDYSKKSAKGFNEAKEELRSLLRDSVKKRLMSDVPYGAFLSGGIDSTVIAAIMSDLCDEPVKTFTIGFKEKKYDERNFASVAVRGINKCAVHKLEHHEKIVNPENFSVIQELVRHYGEPFSDASMLPTYLLSRFTREHVTVALSGDGADEIFAGYNRYLVMKYARLADSLPLGLRKKLFGALSKILPPKTEERTFFGKLQRILQIASSKPGERYLDLISRFSEDMKEEIYGDLLRNFKPHSTQELMKGLESISTSKNYVEKIMEADLHSYLAGDILTKVDIASMANSLEVRSPYMDHRIVEFAASLPLYFKQQGVSRKHILKESFRDLIPKTLLQRKKMGFGVPVAKWLRGKWDKHLRGHLLEGRSVREGFFRKEILEQLIKEHQKLQADHSYALWSLLIFELFLESSAPQNGTS